MRKVLTLLSGLVVLSHSAGATEAIVPNSPVEADRKAAAFPFSMPYLDTVRWLNAYGTSKKLKIDTLLLPVRNFDGAVPSAPGNSSTVSVDRVQG